jgi:uncharacterized coiled-coil protein SlyX
MTTAGDHSPLAGRRWDDRDKALTARLDHLEQESTANGKAIAAVQQDLSLLKVDAQHLKELFASRLSTIETGQALQLAKIEALSERITAMASEPEKTPAGRALITLIETVDGRVKETIAELDRHNIRHEELERWRSNIDGVIFFGKWLGVVGISAMLAGLLKIFGKL